MDAFIEVFGDIRLSTVALTIAAIVFLAKIYKTVTSNLKEKYNREKDREESLQSVIEQAKQYPEWHKRSLEIQGRFSAAIEEIRDELKSQKATLDKTARSIDENEATVCRYRILRFNDELIHEEKHTKEHFDQVLDDITRYEKYCDEHPEYENNKAVLAVENVKATYKKCVDKSMFL